MDIDKEKMVEEGKEKALQAAGTAKTGIMHAVADVKKLVMTDKIFAGLLAFTVLVFIVSTSLKVLGGGSSFSFSGGGGDCAVPGKGWQQNNDGSFVNLGKNYKFTARLGVYIKRNYFNEQINSNVSDTIPLLRTGPFDCQSVKDAKKLIDTFKAKGGKLDDGKDFKGFQVLASYQLKGTVFGNVIDKYRLSKETYENGKEAIKAIEEAFKVVNNRIKTLDN